MRGKMRPLKPAAADATILDAELAKRTASATVRVVFESATGKRYIGTRTVKIRLRKERLRQPPLFPDGPEEPAPAADAPPAAEPIVDDDIPF